MTAKMGFEIRGKLNPDALPAWSFQRYKHATKKTDAEALEYILERWALLDPEAARYGASVEDFRHHSEEGGRVVSISRKPKVAQKAEKELPNKLLKGQLDPAT
jgi:hypothetical protein